MTVLMKSTTTGAGSGLLGSKSSAHIAELEHGKAKELQHNVA